MYLGSWVPLGFASAAGSRKHASMQQASVWRRRGSASRRVLKPINYDLAFRQIARCTVRQIERYACRLDPWSRNAHRKIVLSHDTPEIGSVLCGEFHLSGLPTERMLV